MGPLEVPVTGSCPTLSCIVPDSVNESPAGMPCTLTLPAADPETSGDEERVLPHSPTHTHIPVAAQSREADTAQSEQPETDAGEGAVGEPEHSTAVQQPAAAPLDPPQQAPAPEHEQPCDGDEECPETAGHTKTSNEHAALGMADDSAFEAPVEATENSDPECLIGAAKQVCNGGAAAAPGPSRLPSEAAGVPEQAATAAPVVSAPVGQKLDASAAAAPTGSGGDGTVCDSEDACMGDGAAVESAPAPGHKQAEAREKQCMSDTVQDTRTQGLHNDGNVPDSQQVRTMAHSFSLCAVVGALYTSWSRLVAERNLSFPLPRTLRQAAA